MLLLFIRPIRLELQFTETILYYYKYILFSKVDELEETRIKSPIHNDKMYSKMSHLRFDLVHGSTLLEAEKAGIREGFD